MPNIDEKVVQMQFDNSEFDPNIKKSQKTFEEFEKTLEFDKGSKALKNFQKDMDKVDTKGLSNQLGKLGESFSALETVAVGALLSVGNRLENFLNNTLRTTLIQGANQGWADYGEKVTSVQTIMAATATQFNDTGEQIAYVTDQLEELRTFTDETSYSFKDMTSNIGKFTAQGVDLHTAVTAMQGISTWAALSGANSVEASRAYYNLSQAIGTGAVKLIDWKSIENANMATVEFKQTVLDVAEAEGLLKKQADGTYKTLQDHAVSISNFNQNLSDNWFTSDVLLKSLDVYGGFAQKLLTYTNEMENVSVRKAMKWIDEYREGILSLDEAYTLAGEDGALVVEMLEELGTETYDLGRRAFRAAQETKTFGEAWTYVLGTIATGWSQSWELIFGDYQQARDFWTDITDDLYEIFITVGEFRNEVLNLWSKTFGRDDFVATIQALREFFFGFDKAGEHIKGVRDYIKEAWEAVFPFWNNSEKIASALVRITSKIRDWAETLRDNEPLMQKIGQVTNFLAKAFKFLLGVAKSIYTFFAPSIRWTKSLLSALSPLVQKLADGTSSLLGFKDGLKAMQLAFLVLGAAVAYPIRLINNFIDWLNEIGNSTLPQLEEKFDKWKENIKNVWNGIIKSFRGMGKNIVNAFSIGVLDGFGAIIEAITLVFSSVIELVEAILGIHSPSKIFIAIGMLVMAGLLIGLTIGFDTISKFFATVGEKLKIYGKTFVNGPLAVVWEKIKAAFQWVGAAATKAVTKLGDAIKRLGKFLKENVDIIKNYAQALLLLATAISEVRLAFGLGKFLANLGTGIKRISKYLGWLVDAVSMYARAELFESFGDMAIKIAASILALAAAFYALSKTDLSNAKQVGAVLGSIAGGLLAMITVMAVLATVMTKIGGMKSNFEATGGKGIFGTLFAKISGEVIGAYEARANLIAMSASILLLTAAVVVIVAAFIKLTETIKENNLQPKDIFTYFGYLLGLIAILGVLSSVMSKIAGKSSGRMLSAIINVVVLSAAVGKLKDVLAPAFERIGGIFTEVYNAANSDGWDKANTTFIKRFFYELNKRCGALIAGILVTTALVGLAGLALLALGAGLSKLGPLVLLNFTALIAVFVLLTKTIDKFIGEDPKAAGDKLGIFAAALGIFVGFLTVVLAELMILALIARKAHTGFGTVEDLPKLLVALAAFFAVMALAVMAMPTISEHDVLKFALIILSLSALLGVVMALLVAAANVGSTDLKRTTQLIVALTAMIFVVSGFAIAFSALEKKGYSFNNALTTLGAIAVLAAFMGTAFTIMANNLEGGDLAKLSALLGLAVGVIASVGAMIWAVKELGITYDDIELFATIAGLALAIAIVLGILAEKIGLINVKSIAITIGLIGAVVTVMWTFVGAGLLMRDVCISISDGLSYLSTALMNIFRHIFEFVKSFQGMWGDIYINLALFAGAMWIVSAALVVVSIAGVAFGLALTTISVALIILATGLAIASGAFVTFGLGILAIGSAFVFVSNMIADNSEKIKQAFATLFSIFVSWDAVKFAGVLFLIGTSFIWLGVGSIVLAVGLILLGVAGTVATLSIISLAAAVALCVMLFNWLDPYIDTFIKNMEKFANPRFIDGATALALALLEIGLASLFLLPIISTLFIGITGIILAISAVIASLTGLSLAVSALFYSLMEFTNFLANNKDGVAGVIDMLRGKVTDITFIMYEFAKGVLAVAGAMLVLAIALVIAGAGVILVATGVTILAATTAAFMVVLVLFILFINWLKTENEDLYNKFMQVFTAIADFFTWASGYLERHEDQIATFFDLVNRFLDVCITGLEIVTDIIEVLWFDVLKPIVQWISKVFRLFVSIVEMIVDTIITNKDRIKQAINDLWDKIKTFFTNIVENVPEPIKNFFNFGKDLVNGFVEGIKSGDSKSALKNAIDNLGKFIVNTFHNGELEFGSPSLRMIEYGEDAVEGYIIGENNKKKDLAKSIDELEELAHERYSRLSIVGDGKVSATGALKSIGDDIKNTFSRVTKGEVTIGEGLKAIWESIKLHGGSFLSGKINDIKDKLLGGDLLGSFKDLFKDVDLFGDLDLKKILEDMEANQEDIYKAIDTSNLGDIGNIGNTEAIGQQGSINTYEFVQNNYSPKALSRIEIYRQTNRQFNNFRTREVLAR